MKRYLVLQLGHDLYYSSVSFSFPIFMIITKGRLTNDEEEDWQLAIL